MYDSIFISDLFSYLIIPLVFNLILYIVQAAYLYYCMQYEDVYVFYEQYKKLFIIASIVFVVLEITIICNYFLCK